MQLRSEKNVIHPEVTPQHSGMETHNLKVVRSNATTANNAWTCGVPLCADRLMDVLFQDAGEQAEIRLACWGDYPEGRS
nr:hypothetical protein [Mesorhizobium sp.]